MDFQAMVNDTNQKNSFMLHNGIQLPLSKVQVLNRAI